MNSKQAKTKLMLIAKDSKLVREEDNPGSISPNNETFQSPKHRKEKSKLSTNPSKRSVSASRGVFHQRASPKSEFSKKYSRSRSNLRDT